MEIDTILHPSTSASSSATSNSVEQQKSRKDGGKNAKLLLNMVLQALCKSYINV